MKPTEDWRKDDPFLNIVFSFFFQDKIFGL